MRRTVVAAGIREEALAARPSLKPQRLMRQLVWASLPLGEGVVLDRFMGSGSGSTIAIAVALCEQRSA